MIVFPDYKNNILNISATLADYLGIENSYPKLDIIQKRLNKHYKNVIFIIFDAMGYYNLKNHLSEDDILVRNTKTKITSVFPSTTTNATTTMMSLSYPGEHCWLGWSLYFKEIDACVDIFLNKLSGQNKYLEKDFVFNLMPYDSYYNQKPDNDISVYTLFPEFVETGVSQNHYSYNGIADMFAQLNAINRTCERKMIYVYCNEPDQTMHQCGATSQTAGKLIKDINNRVTVLHNQIEDTLIIITADHGQIDVTDYIALYQDRELNNYLNRPLAMETRATAISVDPMQEKTFERFFNGKYGEHSLYKTSDLISTGVFGPTLRRRARDFLGHFIAVPKQNSGFLLHKATLPYPGNHGGLTPEEMYVPLILIER